MMRSRAEPRPAAWCYRQIRRKPQKASHDRGRYLKVDGPNLNAGDQIFSELKNLCVWNKTNGGMGTFYRSKHELIFVFKIGAAISRKAR
jgi:hypothetical protein